MSEKELDTRSCCEGVKALTPVRVQNNLGLSALVYRVGTHASFKITMQAALSGHPTLRELKTRDDDDPAIALCDAWAIVLDVLSFYQERIANEGFLRTATERRAILELARGLGYELQPGVAAGTYLAFMLEDVAGSPPSAVISIGAKVQSVPGQNELPQTFETAEPLNARPDLNVLKPLRKRREIPHFGDKEIYLKGITTALKSGDGLLMIGAEREADPANERWDFRLINSVVTDKEADFTRVAWDEGLGWRMFNRKVFPAEKNFQVFVLRKRAFLFGYNAPDWRVMPDKVRNRYLDGTDKSSDQNKDLEWPLFDIASISEVPKGKEIKTIYLDALYPQIVMHSWIVLIAPKRKEPKHYVEVYEVLEAVESSRKGYAVTAKTTAVMLNGENLRQKFNKCVRETVVYCQNEELEIAEKPLADPVEGDEIILEKRLLDLENNRKIIVSGKRMRIRIMDSFKKMELTASDGSQTVPLRLGDSLIVMESLKINTDGRATWTLMDKNGFKGTVSAGFNKVQWAPAEKDDSVVSELAMIESSKLDDYCMTIKLDRLLANSFDRSTVEIYANVAKATHGETKEEVLGSGDGSQEFQKFELKQKLLTYVSAATPGGAETTLEIRVNDLLWREVFSFYGHGSEEHIYVTHTNDEGKTTVIFGDGKTGLRLPTGQENVRAKYRIGLGLPGLLKPKQLSQLMSRPLGVKSVTNPLTSTGAANPEERDKARQNTPLKVLTLDRIVSLQDFEDFSRAFAGIGKAQATLLWNGERKIVHITVAAADGGFVNETSDLYKNLINGIDAARHPDHHICVDSYKSLRFNLKAKVQVDSDYIKKDVLIAVSDALRNAFAFETRNFGQPVTPSEVLAVMQKVKGVVSIDLDDLNGQDPFKKPLFRIPADIAHWDKNTREIEAAELLTINPDGIVLWSR